MSIWDHKDIGGEEDGISKESHDGPEDLRVWHLVGDIGAAGIDSCEESGHGGRPQMHGITS